MPKGRTKNPELYADTVTAIREFQSENGYLPSIAQLAELIGRGTTATHYRLKMAVEAGLLRYNNRRYIPN